MLSAMTPTIVTDPAGDLRLVVGSPGGATIITTVFPIRLAWIAAVMPAEVPPKTTMSKSPVIGTAGVAAWVKPNEKTSVTTTLEHQS